MKISLLVLLLSFAALGQEPPAGAPPGGHPPMPAPKNLKVLPPDHLIEVMRTYTVSLGVKCDFCHVAGNFASDEKRHKLIARDMIVMANEINAKYPAVESKVTCFTCHHGAEEPARRPGETPAADHAEHNEHP